MAAFGGCMDDPVQTPKGNEIKTDTSDPDPYTQKVAATKAIVSTGNNYSNRRLRYLYHANGGLVGYFSDGTVAGCPQCDLLKKDVNALYYADPVDIYTIRDSCLLIDGRDLQCPTADGWAMIDYKWLVDL
jgi:hypothetical protein